jgi:hypothetical protein
MTLKLKVAITAAGALALAGAGIATAAVTGHGGKRAAMAIRGLGHPGGGGPADDLAAAASYLGVTTAALQTDLQSGKTLAQAAAADGKTAAGLVTALVTHEQAEIAAKVTAGTLTQAQADTISAGLTQRLTDLVNGTMPMHGPRGMGPMGMGPGMHGGMHGGGPADDLATAAAYLGLTTAELQSDAQAGKTLAQVATATSGKSPAGLIAALVTAEKAEHAAAVTAGTLTQAQADAIDANLTQRLTDLVNGVRPPFGHRP